MFVAHAAALLADVHPVADDDGLAGTAHPAGEHLDVAGCADDLDRRPVGDRFGHPAAFLLALDVVAARPLPVVCLQPQGVGGHHLRHDGVQVAGREAASLHGLYHELVGRHRPQCLGNSRGRAPGQHLLHQGELAGAGVVLVEVGLHLGGHPYPVPVALVGLQRQQLPRPLQVPFEPLPQPLRPPAAHRRDGELEPEEPPDAHRPAQHLRPVGAAPQERRHGLDAVPLGGLADSRMPQVLSPLDAVGGAPCVGRDAPRAEHYRPQAVLPEHVQQRVEPPEAFPDGLGPVVEGPARDEQAHGVQAEVAHLPEVALQEGLVELPVLAHPVRPAGARAAAEVADAVVAPRPAVQNQVPVLVGGHERVHPSPRPLKVSGIGRAIVGAGAAATSAGLTARRGGP